jgi:hypothetical protein
MLIKDPEVQPFFRNYIENIVENVLATSDLRILKRLAAVETVLELNDYPIENDEAESTIPKGLFPTFTVAVTLFVAISIIETLLLPKFATYTLVPVGLTATP